MKHINIEIIVDYLHKDKVKCGHHYEDSDYEGGRNNDVELILDKESKTVNN